MVELEHGLQPSVKHNTMLRDLTKCPGGRSHDHICTVRLQRSCRSSAVLVAVLGASRYLMIEDSEYALLLMMCDVC